MQSTLSVDDAELLDAVGQLKRCLITDTPVPLDVYTTLEDFGIFIDELIQQLEIEIHGESNFHDSYWGC